MNRARACTRKLPTNLRRVIREILRQQAAPVGVGVLQRLLATAQRIHAQQSLPTKAKKGDLGLRPIFHQHVERIEAKPGKNVRTATGAAPA